MNREKYDRIKKEFPELMPAETLNNELKLFFPETLLDDKEKHIAQIKVVEGFGFKFSREVFDIGNGCIAYFRG